MDVGWDGCKIEVQKIKDMDSSPLNNPKHYHNIVTEGERETLLVGVMLFQTDL